TTRAARVAELLSQSSRRTAARAEYHEDWSRHFLDGESKAVPVVNRSDRNGAGRRPPVSDREPPGELTRRARAPSLAVSGQRGGPRLLRTTGLDGSGLAVHAHHHGPHDLVSQSLPLSVPQRHQVTDVADHAVDHVAEVAQERVAETDRLTGLLADGLDLDHLLAERLTGGPPGGTPNSRSGELHRQAVAPRTPPGRRSRRSRHRCHFRC